MKVRQYIFALFVTALVSVALGARGENCTSAVVDGSTVTFRMDNGSAVQLKLCSQSVVKFWVIPQGAFLRHNPSLAVVNEALGDVGVLNMQEQAACYEIFTEKLRIRVNKSPFSYQIFDKYQKLIFSDYAAQGRKTEGTRKIEYKTLRRDEHIFGLGEKSGKMDRRGESYKMWNRDKPCYSTVEDPLYKSIPFFISNYHYGIFLDNTYMTEFKFGTEHRDCFSFEAPDGEMVYYFIYGKDYKEIMKGYIGLTGRPVMPPRWAFGFAQCRGLLTRQDLTYDIAQGYRKRGIPCDIIYQDIGWTENLQDFSWRKSNYSAPRVMLADLHRMGFKVIVSQDPVVSQTNRAQWHEADSLGYFVKDARSGKSYNMPWPWGGDCGLVDFTLPAVADWWGAYQQRCIDDGVSGFWTDMGEPAWSNEDSPDRLNMRHFAGSHAEIHNVYGLTWDKVVTEQFNKRNPDRRVFQMTRSAFAGVQRYAFGWTGDSGNGDDVLQGWGQMANQIPVCLSAGLGGIEFNTCDISGYCGDIKDYPAMAELYTRWVQLGAFTALSRIHHEGDNACEPWLFGEEAERNVKAAIELKYRLLPYIYTCARESYDEGVPLMRPMFMEFPMDQEAYASADAQFMFGQNLLVAPVLKKGVTSRSVYFPEGKWIDYNDKSTTFSGEGWATVDAPLSRVPLFVRQGSIIPTMPVMNFSDEKRDCNVTFEIFPAAVGGTATYSLYEDHGGNLGYQRGEWARTPISCTSAPAGFAIKMGSREGSGYQVPRRNTIIELYTMRVPKSVTIAGRKVKKVNDKAFSAAAKLPVDSQILWNWDNINHKCCVIFCNEGQETNLSVNFN